MTKHNRSLEHVKARSKNITYEQDLSHFELAHQISGLVLEHDKKQKKSQATLEICGYCPLLQRNI